MKTTLQAGLASYMAGFDHEKGAEVYALANSQAQSRLLFEETTNMIKASPYLDERFNVRRTDIVHKKSLSTIKALSAEKSNKDGYNTHFAVFDEIHEYKTYDLIEVMRRSMGARIQPLTIYISTAGYVLDGPMTDFFREGQETLENYEDNLNERSFYFLAKLDDIKEADDPEYWIKANPNLPMMAGKNLLSDYKKDKRNPQQRADWITKQFNLFSESGAQSFMDAAVILANDDVIDESELEGLHPAAGFDLSDTEDFTAAALEFALPDGRVYVKQQTWIPQARYDREEQYKARFDEWIEAGDMIVLPGQYVDHGYVYDWLVEQDEKYGLQQINYDMAKAITLNTMLQDYGVKTMITRQGFTTLGPALQNFKELMLDHKVVFNNSRIFKWYLSNVALVTDRNNNWLPTKVSRYRKIDGFAAMLNAHVTIAPQLVQQTADTGNVTYWSMEDIMSGQF
ncbi:terminase large subunit [Weissella confusa]|uniref:terminase large subunit n=1 Tax=Weissella confusa TaxID=1583 RepID=UPI00223BB662|nr:terminase TerL endonuclease subunit [Weissella confusa]MCS9997189.1 terminase large subunit [Weissella confusa]